MSSSRGYGSTPGATSREQSVITRLAEAERRVGDRWVLSALGDGLDLIRELITDRAHRRDLEPSDAQVEPVDWIPPEPGFEPDATPTDF